MTVTAARVRSVDQLVGLIGNGGAAKFLYFWGHRPPTGGGVGKGCLRQWWPTAFTVDGLEDPTAEHFMMAAKARLFGDAAIAERIRAAPHPRAAKALGRQVRDFDEERWTQERFELVVTGNLTKFSQHPEPGEFLVGSGERVLVEASPVDAVGGSGFRRTTIERPRPLSGRGSTCSASRSWKCEHD